MTHALNRYGNYDHETNSDAHEYEKRQCEREEEYWRGIDHELERDYFGVREEELECGK